MSTKKGTVAHHRKQVNGPPPSELREISQKRYSNLTMAPATWYNNGMNSIPEKDRPTPQPPSVIRRQVREQVSPKRNENEDGDGKPQRDDNNKNATPRREKDALGRQQHRFPTPLTPAEYMNRSVPHFKSPRAPTRPIETSLYPKRLRREEILAGEGQEEDQQAVEENDHQQEIEGCKQQDDEHMNSSSRRRGGKYSAAIAEKTESLRKRLQANKDYFISRHSFERIKRRAERTIYMRELTAVWSERTDRSPLWVDQEVAMKKSFEKLEKEQRMASISRSRKRAGRQEEEEDVGNSGEDNKEDTGTSEKDTRDEFNDDDDDDDDETSTVECSVERKKLRSTETNNDDDDEHHHRHIEYQSSGTWLPKVTANTFTRPITRFYAGSEVYKKTPRYPKRSGGGGGCKQFQPPSCAPKKHPWEDSDEEEEEEEENDVKKEQKERKKTSSSSSSSATPAASKSESKQMSDRNMKKTKKRKDSTKKTSKAKKKKSGKDAVDSVGGERATEQEEEEENGGNPESSPSTPKTTTTEQQKTTEQEEDDDETREVDKEEEEEEEEHQRQKSSSDKDSFEL